MGCNDAIRAPVEKVWVARVPAEVLAAFRTVRPAMADTTGEEGEQANADSR